MHLLPTFESRSTDCAWQCSSAIVRPVGNGPRQFRRIEITEDRPAALLDGDWNIAWHDHLVPLVLVASWVGIWIGLSPDDATRSFGTSWRQVNDGYIQTVVLHAFAHGSLVHLGLNAAAILVLGGPLVSRLGRPPISWFRFLYLFTGSAVCGAALFLLLNREGHSLLIGASGGIFGVLGALARVNPVTGGSVPVYSARTVQLLRFFVINHAALFVLVLVFALAFGSFAMVAWEAHLGGLLFGFFAATLYLHSSRE